jgi:rSAM/selenodomain-associated transferase 2
MAAIRSIQKIISTRDRIRPGTSEGNIEVELAVIIPTLDEEPSIGGCLESVGTHENVEVVVSDGGSSDRTRVFARSAGARVVTGARGRGPQLNLGAASTDSPRLLFLHADCRLPAGWLPEINRALDDECVSLACFQLRTLPSGGSEASRMCRWWLRVFDLRSRGFRLPYGDQGFAVRRPVFENAGRYPEIPLMEDVAFASACRRLGRVRRLPMEIRTSARRVERRPFRTTLMLAALPTLFRLGVDPRTLARWYGNGR